MNNTGFGASAAWVDYDKDGKLDLFVTNYVKWTQEGRYLLHARRPAQILLPPDVYKGDSCRLFHNLGNGRFEDVTQQAGHLRSDFKVAGRGGD